MNRCFLRASVMAGLLAAGVASQAFVWTFDVPLSGLSENPPNASPAFGHSFGTYDDVSNQLIMDTMVTGLTAPATAAHIHEAPVGVNGPVRVPLTGATGSTTYNSHDVPLLSAALESALFAGNCYVNVHSQTFPGGEVRGQMRLVPEPATMIALVAGIAGVAMRRRAKK